MTRLFVLAFALLLAGRCLAVDGGYLFVTFRGEATPLTEQIYFGLGQDGRAWDGLNDSNPVLGALQFTLPVDTGAKRFYRISVRRM